MANGDLRHLFCFDCKYFSKSDKMVAWEKWSSNQKPEAVLTPEEYDKRFETDHSNDNPKPINITILKTPSENDPQFDTSGKCNFHEIDIVESFEGMLCLDWKTKEDEALMKARIKLFRKENPEFYKYKDTFKSRVFKKLEPGYLYHWIYKTKLPPNPFIVHRTNNGYVLIRVNEIIKRKS